jgi:pescadillo protein
LTKKEEQIRRQKALFKNLSFQLNRETPIWCLQHLVLSFGGNFASDDVPLSKGEKATHHVMDRPLQADKLVKNVEYIQPQWVVDSINNLYLLPVNPYKPGIPPPPHLSPFVDDVKEGYIPSRKREILNIKGEEIEESEEEDAEMLSSEEEEQAPKAAP